MNERFLLVKNKYVVHMSLIICVLFLLLTNQFHPQLYQSVSSCVRLICHASALAPLSRTERGIQSPITSEEETRYSMLILAAAIWDHGGRFGSKIANNLDTVFYRIDKLGIGPEEYPEKRHAWEQLRRRLWQVSCRRTGIESAVEYFEKLLYSGKSAGEIKSGIGELKYLRDQKAAGLIDEEDINAMRLREIELALQDVDALIMEHQYDKPGMRRKIYDMLHGAYIQWIEEALGALDEAQLFLDFVHHVRQKKGIDPAGGSYDENVPFARMLRAAQVYDVSEMRETCTALRSFLTGRLDCMPVDVYELLFDGDPVHDKWRIKLSGLLEEGAFGQVRLDIPEVRSDDDIWARTDTNLLFIAVERLVSNAVNQCQKNENSESSKTVKIELKYQDGSIQIIVSNEGEIPQELLDVRDGNLQAIFVLNHAREHFSKNIGLKLAERAVRMIGGSLRAESQNGRAGFIITVPSMTVRDRQLSILSPADVLELQSQMRPVLPADVFTRDFDASRVFVTTERATQQAAGELDIGEDSIFLGVGASGWQIENMLSVIDSRRFSQAVFMNVNHYALLLLKWRAFLMSVCETREEFCRRLFYRPENAMFPSWQKVFAETVAPGPLSYRVYYPNDPIWGHPKCANYFKNAEELRDMIDFMNDPLFLNPCQDLRQSEFWSFIRDGILRSDTAYGNARSLYARNAVVFLHASVTDPQNIAAIAKWIQSAGGSIGLMYMSNIPYIPVYIPEGAQSLGRALVSIKGIVKPQTPCIVTVSSHQGISISPLDAHAAHTVRWELWHAELTGDVEKIMELYRGAAMRHEFAIIDQSITRLIEQKSPWVIIDLSCRIGKERECFDKLLQYRRNGTLFISDHASYRNAAEVTYQTLTEECEAIRSLMQEDENNSIVVHLKEHRLFPSTNDELIGAYHKVIRRFGPGIISSGPSVAACLLYLMEQYNQYPLDYLAIILNQWMNETPGTFSVIFEGMTRPGMKLNSEDIAAWILSRVGASPAGDDLGLTAESIEKTAAFLTKALGKDAYETAVCIAV